MLRNLYLVPVLALFLLPALANAQFEAGNWDLQLSGSGTAASGGSANTFDASISGNIGYLMTKELEVGWRHTTTWTDGGSFTSGFDAAFLDYHFDLDRWQPFIGANIGYVYGTNLEDNWAAGPEAGVKYFVNSTTYIEGFAAYEWNLNDGPQAGVYQYGVAIGFKF